MSAATNQGLDELFKHVAEILKELPKEDLIDVEEKVVYTLDEKDEGFNVEVINGEFVVTGRAIERLMGRINVEDNESMNYLQKCMRKMGIDDALKAKGIREGDSVVLDDWEFEWYE